MVVYFENSLLKQFFLNSIIGFGDPNFISKLIKNKKECFLKTWCIDLFFRRYFMINHDLFSAPFPPPPQTICCAFQML